MRWENLKNFECPYCGWTLLKTVPDITCSHCEFVLEYGRFKSILEHRHNEKPDKPIKWQNLRDARCPICSDLLIVVTEGKFMFEKCIAEECTFKINNERLQEILADQTHPANRFYKELTETNENIERQTADLG